MPQTTRIMPGARQGVTLIELVLAMAISLVALLIVVLGYNIGTKTFTQETSRSDFFWEGSRGVQTVTEELRGCLELTSADSDSISFWWEDLNDNSTMEANEVVDYSVSNQILVRTQGTETKPLVHNVISFDLTYDDLADPELITVTLTMLKEGNMVTLESKANLRNK
ncbi:MAG: prepilin-type N-terminal cleavage/methylation domain-containing protein [Candidatus Margulisiibacteriota bacterium]